MCSKLTYFQSKYVKMYLNAEERELKQAIEEKDSVQTWNSRLAVFHRFNFRPLKKSLAEARSQVEYFMSEQRKKEDWDTIARMKCSLNPRSMRGENYIYSALDGWYREKMEAKKNNSGSELNTPLLQ